MFRKRKSSVEGDPKKSWSIIQTKAGVKKEQVGQEVSLVETTKSSSLLISVLFTIKNATVIWFEIYCTM